MWLVPRTESRYKFGMFQHLGEWIARRPAWLILGWAILVGAGVVWACLATAPPASDLGSVLPLDHPLNKAVQLVREAYPRLDARSQIVLIAFRTTGLERRDLEWMGRIGQTIEREMGNQVLSPTVSFLRHRLVSQDNQAATLVVNLPTGFISAAAADSVARVEALVAGNPPPGGLTTELTGTAGIGRDYGIATQKALHRTTWVTVVAVLAILVFVYRSPVGAFVPLVSIGASVFVALVLLSVLVWFGGNVSTLERIFSVVLIFGMGVDFALFWIARYREELRSSDDYDAAALAATRHSGPAIFVSAATTICGLTTMLATHLIPTQNAGKILAMVLTVALLASLTLAPALARLLGRGLFWPLGLGGEAALGEGRAWPLVAGVVTRRPRLVLAAGLIALGVPAFLSTRMEPRFDSLSELPPGSSSLRGFNLANEHFDRGQIYSNNVMLQFARMRPVTELHRISRLVSDRMAAVSGVHDVYSLDAPLGRGRAGASAKVGAAMAWLSQSLEPDAAASAPAMSLLKKLPFASGIEDTGQMIRTFYLADRPPMLRFEVLIDYLPFSPEAMALGERLTGVIEQAVAEAVPAGERPAVLQAGPTPYILAVRDVSSGDQVRVKVLASAVIALIVFALIRDLPLTLFMLGATWLTYGATIALSQGFFVCIMGENGLDWKVRLIVFVIIVAVGQDYNIFLVSRLFQEPADLTDAEAARRAIIRTGSVISNCGLIMAATLGSLWAGRLGLLRQTGFALALGILLDTFFVRPLLLPSFFLAMRRRRRRGALGREAGPETGH